MKRVWVGDGLVETGNARVSVLDRGFTLGDGLFETMRAYDGRVFRLAAHLERLERGAARIDLPVPHDLSAAVKETLRANRVANGVVRLTLTRGEAPPGLRLPETPRPTLVITVAPYAPDERQRAEGVQAITASGKLNEHAATAGLKQLGYLGPVLAQREAHVAGADEALLLDTAGHLAEAAAANLFLVRGGALLTPPLHCGILPGITRAVVLEMAERLEIAATEASLEPGDLATADEAFLTSSLREIVPLVRVDGRAIGGGRPGEVTRRLQGAYRRLVTEALT